MMKETNVVDIGDVIGISECSIVLKDGTELNVRLNATVFESKVKIDKSVFTADNLSNVTIDGVKQGRMVLRNFFIADGMTYFALGRLTEEERFQEETTFIQNALAEVYEMLLSGM